VAAYGTNIQVTKCKWFNGSQERQSTRGASTVGDGTCMSICGLLRNEEAIKSSQ
jgi:hypothetical protein